MKIISIVPWRRDRPGKPQGVEERVVDQQKDETGHADDAAAEVDESFRSLDNA